MDESERDGGSGVAGRGVQHTVVLRRGVLATVSGLVIIVVAFAITFAVLERARAERNASSANARSAAAATASAFAVDLYSYDYADLAAARVRLLSLADATFAKTYNAQYAQGLQAALQGLKAVSSATARQVYMDEPSGRDATGMVQLDTDLRTASGTRQGVTYLLVTLVRSGTSWKVDAARAIASPAAG